jgi:hypothetical protein
VGCHNNRPAYLFTVSLKQCHHFPLSISINSTCISGKKEDNFAKRLNDNETD